MHNVHLFTKFHCSGSSVLLVIAINPKGKKISQRARFLLFYVMHKWYATRSHGRSKIRYRTLGLYRDPIIKSRSHLINPFVRHLLLQRFYVLLYPSKSATIVHHRKWACVQSKEAKEHGHRTWM